MSNGFYKTAPGFLSKWSAESESERLGIEREIEAERERDAERNAWYKNSFLGALAASKIRNSITQRQTVRYDSQGRPMYQLKEDTPFWKHLWLTKDDYEKVNYGANAASNKSIGGRVDGLPSAKKPLAPTNTSQVPNRQPTNTGQPTKTLDVGKRVGESTTKVRGIDRSLLPDLFFKANNAVQTTNTASQAVTTAGQTTNTASQAASEGGEAAAQSGSLLGTLGSIVGGAGGLFSMYQGLKPKNQMPAHMRDAATARDVLGTTSGALGVASAVPGPHQIVTAPLAGLLGLLGMVV